MNRLVRRLALRLEAGEMNRLAREIMEVALGIRHLASQI
jgi:hypothetical protein